MSLERRRETEEPDEEKMLEESIFRQKDFTPLGEKLRKNQLIEENVEEALVEEELTVIERDVLDIAGDILKLKRYDSEFSIDSKAEIQKYPIIEKLYAKCISKLSYNKGYSKDDIFLAIRSLEEKNWIVTNERRTKLEILQNEKLNRILDFIKDNPGIHARDEKIEKDLNITRTPFLKHVMTLERFNLIRSKKIGKSLHYFPIDIEEHEELDNFKVLFLNPLIPNILEQFLKDDSVSIAQIGENLEIYSGTIQYHVKKLKDLNLIKSIKNDTGKKHLVNIELLKVYNEIFKEPDFSKLLNGL
ncbi:MAG: winged helix-turn-helix transcriptional regulator [Promethearchaeota archaeon]|nr:MAG: winged helix-turn-helix transcriptional regulator [Candidatus Lokiarchaeota archaeon]